jgi:hypothetical protein
MQPDSKNKKKPYSPPTVTNQTPERAKQFVADRANCSDQEAADFLESLRREQQQNDPRRNLPKPLSTAKNGKGSA